MPNIHPFIVHFPIALLTVSLVFDVIAWIRSNGVFSMIGWWNQLAGTVLLAAAVGSGLLAKGTVSISVGAAALLEIHEQCALWGGVLFAVLLFWRISSKTRIPGKFVVAYLALFAAGILLMWVGALYGGEMVYGFGTGVRAPQ